MRLKPAVVVGLVAAAAQATAIRDVFLWDDVVLLHRSDLYTSAARWLESVSAPLGGGTYYWRPAATTTFLLESLAHGGAAWGFRLTSSLLHGVTAALAFTLLARLLRNPAAALIAALAFALHPVNVEAVVWPSARFDVFAALACLAALVATQSSLARTAKWTVAAALAALALLSKESALLLPVVGVLWNEATGDSEGRPRLAPALWLGTGTALALFLRFEALGYLFRARDASVAEAGGALQRVLLVGRALATSVETLVFPWGTVGPAHHGVRPIPDGDVRGWIGVALGVGLVAATVALVRRRRAVGWLLAAFLATMLPASQIVPLDLAGGLHSADRFLYLPSFFAIAVVAALVLEATRERPAASRFAGRAAVAVLVALAAGRFVVLRDWNDPIRFWTRAADMAPDSDAVLAGLAYAESDAGLVEAAEEHARRAGRIGVPILADILVRTERYAEAQEVLARALEQGPDDSGLRVQRGELRMLLGLGRLAGEDLEAAIALEDGRRGASAVSYLPRALADTARLFAEGGNREVATQRIERAEALASPNDLLTWVRIPPAWIALRDAGRAARALDVAERLGAPPQAVARMRAEIRQIAK